MQYLLFLNTPATVDVFNTKNNKISGKLEKWEFLVQMTCSSWGKKNFWLSISIFICEIVLSIEIDWLIDVIEAKDQLIELMNLKHFVRVSDDEFSVFVCVFKQGISFFESNCLTEGFV